MSAMATPDLRIEPSTATSACRLCGGLDRSTPSSLGADVVAASGSIESSRLTAYVAATAARAAFQPGDHFPSVWDSTLQLVQGDAAVQSRDLSTVVEPSLVALVPTRLAGQ